MNEPRDEQVNASHRVSVRSCDAGLPLPACRLMTGLLLALNACGDPVPITHETEHLRIGSALEHPICAGDLAYYEKVIAKVETDLALDLNRSIDVFIWSDVEWRNHANQYCGGSLYRGCYHHNTATIFTGEYALPHELVHAAVGEPKLQVFFDEGIAEMYAGRQTRFAISAPSSHEGEHKATEVYDLITASHFAHWLLDKWGGERLGKLARLKGAAFRDFEAVYGIPFDVAEQMYFEEAPAAFPAINACDAPSMELVPHTHAWSAAVELDCESGEETRANGSGLFVPRTFRIDSPGPYYFYADQGVMQVALCIESPVEALPNEAEELIEQDVPFIHAGYPSEALRSFPAGEFHQVDLRAGLYIMRVGLDGFERGAVQVDIWPRLGEHSEQTK